MLSLCTKYFFVYLFQNGSGETHNYWLFCVERLRKLAMFSVVNNFCVWIITAGHRRCANSQFPVWQKQKTFSVCSNSFHSRFHCSASANRTMYVAYGVSLVWIWHYFVTYFWLLYGRWIKRKLLTITFAVPIDVWSFDWKFHMKQASSRMNFCPLHLFCMFIIIKFSKTFNFKSFIRSSDSGGIEYARNSEIVQIYLWTRVVSYIFSLSSFRSFFGLGLLHIFFSGFCCWQSVINHFGFGY